MTPARGMGRTQRCSAAQGRTRLVHARKFLDVADPGFWVAFETWSVHGVIPNSFSVSSASSPSIVDARYLAFPSRPPTTS
jgi:hypothetical protein